MNDEQFLTSQAEVFNAVNNIWSARSELRLCEATLRELFLRTLDPELRWIIYCSLEDDE